MESPNKGAPTGRPSHNEVSAMLRAGATLVGLDLSKLDSAIYEASANYDGDRGEQLTTFIVDTIRDLQAAAPESTASPFAPFTAKPMSQAAVDALERMKKTKADEGGVDALKTAVQTQKNRVVRMENDLRAVHAESERAAARVNEAKEALHLLEDALSKREKKLTEKTGG